MILIVFISGDDLTCIKKLETCTCAQLDQWYLDALRLALHRICHVCDHTSSIFLILILIVFISGHDLTCIKKLETCARESELHHMRRKVTVTSLERNNRTWRIIILRRMKSLSYKKRVYHANPHHPDIYISTLICTESTTLI